MATQAEADALTAEIATLKTAVTAYEAREQATIDSLTAQLSNQSSGVPLTQQQADLQGIIDSLSAPVVPVTPPATDTTTATTADTLAGGASA